MSFATSRVIRPDWTSSILSCDGQNRKVRSLPRDLATYQFQTSTVVGRIICQCPFFVLLLTLLVGYFRSLQILRLVLSVVSMEPVEKILWLRRSQYVFEMMFALKTLTPSLTVRLYTNLRRNAQYGVVTMWRQQVAKSRRKRVFEYRNWLALLAQ